MKHAHDVIAERRLDPAWVEKAARTPEWREIDPSDPEVERRFMAISERAGRILRVACVENDREIRIVTAFLDRNARGRR
jgi:hypothetical protein